MGIKSTILLLAAAGLTISAPIDNAPLERRGNLPEPVSAATARQYLSEITVAASSNDPAYQRSYFKTWDTISGNCNTREYVLKRDGTNVQTDSSCAPTSGSWYSDYDGVTGTDSSKIDIDHLVPLKEAWISGAKDWTAKQREDFANDITRPQLLAVTEHSNDSKGDKDITQYLPPQTSYQCKYVRAWVQVKHYYNLAMDSDEMNTASNILAKC